VKTILIFLGLAGVAFLFMGGCSGRFTSWYTDSNGVVHTTQILYLILTGGNAASPACDATPPVMLGR